MSVEAGVKADLQAWEKRLPGVSKSGLAQSALVLAAKMDDPDTYPTAASNCARALNEVVDRILSLLPAERERTELDELRSARARRRAS